MPLNYGVSLNMIRNLKEFIKNMNETTLGISKECLRISREKEILWKKTAE